MKARGVVRPAVLSALALTVLAVLGCSDNRMGEDERAVTQVVERFLRAAGQYDLDSLPLFFAPDANVGAASLQDGEWVIATLTFDEWHASLGPRVDAKPYTEPVSEFTVHVDNGQLAFVRADATLMQDGAPRSHNIDYFTLIRHDGVWKILNGSYTSVPSGSR
jgi:hypothetical protein